jgi:hypothetical protein
MEPLYDFYLILIIVVLVYLFFFLRAVKKPTDPGLRKYLNHCYKRKHKSLKHKIMKKLFFITALLITSLASAQLVNTEHLNHETEVYYGVNVTETPSHVLIRLYDKKTKDSLTFEYRLLEPLTHRGNYVSGFYRAKENDTKVVQMLIKETLIMVQSKGLIKYFKIPYSETHDKF